MDRNCVIKYSITLHHEVRVNLRTRANLWQSVPHLVFREGCLQILHRLGHVELTIHSFHKLQKRTLQFKQKNIHSTAFLHCYHYIRALLCIEETPCLRFGGQAARGQGGKRRKEVSRHLEQVCICCHRDDYPQVDYELELFRYPLSFGETRERMKAYWCSKSLSVLGGVHQMLYVSQNVHLASPKTASANVSRVCAVLKLEVGAMVILTMPLTKEIRMCISFTLTCDSMALMSKLEGREGKRLWRMESAVANPAAVPPLVVTTLESSSSFVLAVLPAPTASNLSGERQQSR